jgi:divalent metal cation (Fe/Co/Zn/Cd) transporter
MLVKIKIHGYEEQDVFEKTALKITGSSFYILVIGLSFTALYNIITNHQPETTYWGIVISLISIVTMALLIFYKNKVGQSLNSKALITDANCTKTCLYLSIILLAASVGYQLTGIGYLDSAGAMAISYFSFMEGKEAFEKARTGKNCTCENGN